MSIPFQITALPEDPFTALFDMDEDELAKRGARSVIADTKPGYPCRVSLEDAEIGETLILLPFVHHETPSPYRASGPVFVRIGARQARLEICEVPDSVRQRLLSVRAYSADGTLVDADVADGQEIETTIDALFTDNHVSYLHLHNARPGCYSCRVDRA